MTTHSIKNFVLMAACFAFATVPPISCAGENRAVPAQGTGPKRFPSGFWVLISPSLTRQQQEHAFAELVTFMIKPDRMRPGDSMHFIDGISRTEAAPRVTIGYEKPWQIEKARMKLLGNEIRALKSYFNGNRSNSTSSHSSQHVEGNLDWPQLFRDLGQRVEAKPARRNVIIVVGSPIYVEKNGSISFVEKFPTDGHILASEEITLFGLDGVAPFLKDVSVVWAHPPTIAWKSNAHRYRIKRFVRNWLRKAGAVPIYFGPDLKAALEIGCSDNKSENDPSDDIDPNEKEVAMIPAVRVEAPVHKVTKSLPVPRRTVSTHFEHLTIKAIWKDPALDIDLYVQTSPTRELCYDCPKDGDYAIFEKDYWAIPKVKNGYEAVFFNTPVAVEDVPKVWVNFFRGHATQGASGRIEIQANGHNCQLEFNIRAKNGNGGVDRDGDRSASDHWINVDIKTPLQHMLNGSGTLNTKPSSEVQTN